MSTTIWLILWSVYHVCWLRSIRASVQTSPQDLVDAVVSTAVRQMRAVKGR